MISDLFKSLAECICSAEVDSEERIKKQAAPPPNPKCGDRKRLQECLSKIHGSFKQVVENLMNQLDDLLANSAEDMEVMEKQKAEIETILVCVRQWAKKNTKYHTSLTDKLMPAKESSSINTWEFVISRKVLPFLRHFLMQERPDFIITDIIAFDSDRFVYITEEMVIHCNETVGTTAATKRSVLEGWSVLFKTLTSLARNQVGKITYQRMKELVDWYEQRVTDVAPGLTHMGAAAERARLEKKRQQTENFLPVDKAIQLWLNSDTRRRENDTLTDLAGKLRNGETGVVITASVFSNLCDFVKTELSIYWPVRIGSIVRLSVRAVVRCQPAWPPALSEQSEETRPVTVLPENACQHQREGGSSRSLLGLTENGQQCCTEAVPPTCFITSNDQDKGGKSTNYVLITHEGHRLLTDLLLIRDHYFKQQHFKRSGGIEGSCPIFLSTTGKDPPATSNFRLRLFNKAVHGPNSSSSTTPQMLRKWNTTYLHHHKEERVREMRAAATGNNEGVFRQYYDLTRTQGIVKALLASLHRHRSEDDNIQSHSQEVEQRKRRDEAAIEKANEEMLIQQEGVDLTSHTHPVHPHLKLEFREELERVEPGLWTRAGRRGLQKALGLSEMAWIQDVVRVLGRKEAERLREVILEQYGGAEPISKRQWSGIMSHLEVINQDRKNGGEVVR